MKKIFLALLLAAGGALLTAADLTVAEKGRSDYQIVVPESTGNARLDHFVTLGSLRVPLQQRTLEQSPSR